jgi:hypothetical protein
MGPSPEDIAKGWVNVLKHAYGMMPAGIIQTGKSVCDRLQALIHDGGNGVDEIVLIFTLTLCV